MTTQPVPDLAAAAALAPVMDEISAGKLAAADLERIAAERMRATFAVVAGPDDPLWPDHVAVARQVLGLGGIPASELAQWTAATRAREGCSAAVDPGDDSDTESQAVEAAAALEPAGPADVPTADDSDASGAYSGENAAASDDAAVQLTADTTVPEPDQNPYGRNRRILARGRRLPVDPGLRPL